MPVRASGGERRALLECDTDLILPIDIVGGEA